MVRGRFRILGCILVILLLSVSGAWADSGKRTIVVEYRNIGVTVDGNRLPTPDEPILYNDRVFVPARSLAEALGASVEWDADTNTMAVKSLIPQAKEPPISVAQLPLADKVVSTSGTGAVIMGGARYTGARWFDVHDNATREKPDLVEFALDGAYEEFSAAVGYRDGAGAGYLAAEVAVVVDGKEVDRFPVFGDSPPRQFSLKVTGAQRLRLVISRYRDYVVGDELWVAGGAGPAGGVVVPTPSVPPDEVGKFARLLITDKQVADSGTGEVTLYGTHYTAARKVDPHDAMTPETPDFMEFQLNGRFKQLDGLVGYRDGSATGSYAVDVTMLADGKEIAHFPVFGDSQPHWVSTNVAGVQRLRVVLGKYKEYLVGDELWLVGGVAP